MLKLRLCLLFIFGLVACAGAPPTMPPASKAPAAISSATVTPKALGKTAFPAGWALYTNANAVSDLALAPDGSLWAATLGGVVRWEPQTHAYIKFSATNGLPFNNVLTILAAQDGKIWAGSLQGEIASFDGHTWQTHSLPDQIPPSRINDIFQDQQGRIWFATWGAGAIMYNGSTWKSFLQADGLASTVVTSVGEDAQGQIWLGTSPPQCECGGRDNLQGPVQLGISKFDGIDWAILYEEIGLDGNIFGGIVTDFQADQQGLWFATVDGAALTYYDGQRYQHVDAPFKRINDLAIDPQGHLWGAADGGVFSYDGTTWVVYTQSLGALDNKIQAVVSGPDGSIWVGAENGIARFKPTTGWETYRTNTIADTLPYLTPAKDIAFTPTGASWLATSEGVAYLDGKRWQHFTNAAGLPANDTRDITVADNGTVWIRTLVNTMSSLTDTISAYDGKNRVVYDYGDINWFIDFAQNGAFWAWAYDTDTLNYYTPQGQTVYAAPESLSFPDKAFTTPDGRLWIGGEAQDFYTLEAGRWQKVALPSIWLPRNALAPDGTIWFINRNHLFSLKNAQWQRETTLPMAELPIDLACDAKGAVWAIFEPSYQVWVYQSGKWTQFATPNIFPRSIHFAPDGAVWLSADGALARYGEASRP